jgi:hypothetical protein
MAFAMAAATFLGFAPSYFLAGFNDGPTPVLTPRLHIHGALCTAWIVLLIVQTRLIASGRREIHKRLGILSAAIAAAIFVSGLFVAINSQRHVHTAITADTLADPYVFLIFAATSVTMFALFVALGVIARRHPAAHKRLMLLATANLIVPALARLVTQIVQGAGIVGVPGVVGGVLLINVFLAAMVVYDFTTRGRLHAATLWGGAFVVISEPLRFAIGFSEPWQAFARSLMS